MHTELVSVELVLGYLAVVGPEMSEDSKAGDVAVSERGIVKVFDVVIGDSVDDLRAEGLVDFIVSAENGAGDAVETVKFCDLVVGESCGMIEHLRRIDGWNERNVGESGVFSGREGEGNVSMEAIAAVRWDRGGVGIELCLSGTESGVGGRVGGRGDGSEFDCREGGSDDTGG